MGNWLAHYNRRAATAKMVLDDLGVKQLRTLVGPSMGGMSGLALLRRQAGIARHFLAISTAPRAEPFAIAIRSLQREMIVRDPHWQDGAYTNEDWPETGMRLARKLGMISYRSEPEWRTRFARRLQGRYNERLFGMHFAVESYLEKAARKFIRNFDPCCFLYLSRAMDRNDFSAGFADPAAAFALPRLQSVKVIGVHTDFLWPPHQQKEIAEMFAAAGVDSRLEMLDSIQGHDSFLVDYERFCLAVADYFEGLHSDLAREPGLRKLPINGRGLSGGRWTAARDSRRPARQERPCGDQADPGPLTVGEGQQ